MSISTLRQECPAGGIRRRSAREANEDNGPPRSEGSVPKEDDT